MQSNISPEITDPLNDTSIPYSEDFANELRDIEANAIREAQSIVPQRDAIGESLNYVSPLCTNAQQIGHFGIRYPYPYGKLELAQRSVNGTTHNIPISAVIEDGIRLREGGYIQPGIELFNQAFEWITDAEQYGNITPLDATRMKPPIYGHLSIAEFLQHHYAEARSYALQSIAFSVAGAGVNTLPEGLRHFARVGFKQPGYKPENVFFSSILAAKIAKKLGRADEAWFWNGVANTLFEANDLGIDITPRAIWPYVREPLLTAITRKDQRNWYKPSIRNAGRFILLATRKFSRTG